ncbi:MAG TPA: metal ABC transporter permease [Candidatus Jorgensenbacteria bacterium]|nr:metal ABC transporter permease [Candidatus Jorgensenbacteria bacterium]
MLEIFQFDFMIRAFTAGITIAVIAPLIGSFLIVRRYSLMADTLAHVSLLGISVGLITKVNPIGTAIIASVLGAIGIEKLRGGKKISGESALALFLSGSLAIATVVIGLAKGFSVNLFSFLFGSISTVSLIDLYLIIGLGIIVLATIILFYKELFLVSFDEDLAQANGVPAKALNFILVILAAITVSLSIRTIGVLLIGALTVIPVLAAFQYGRSFRQTILLSVIFSLISVISGLFLSFYFALPSGGIIVVVALVIFLLSLAIKKTG